MKTPIYAVFDISHSSMKLTLFDENRQFLDQHEDVCLTDLDDDGFPCESLEHLTQWVLEHWHRLRLHPDYRVQGVNFVAYGSSLVHLGVDDRPVLPLYSYLKPMPEAVTERFFASLGQTPEAFALATRSPYLGLMHSGLQLYWLKYTKPALYAQIHGSLHLPQYLSFLISGEKYSDYTSIGCHTALWDFDRHGYHAWVIREGLDHKLAPLLADAVATVVDGGTLVGVGLHDSSAAVLPHLTRSDLPFAVLATGAWAVTINPFNRRPPTAESLQSNCPHYLSPKGDSFPASRFLLGREHDYQLRRICARFHVPADFYQALPLPAPLVAADAGKIWQRHSSVPATGAPVPAWDLAHFPTAADAYHHLLYGLVVQLCEAVRLAVQNEKVLFVEGRFGENALFVHLLRHLLRHLLPNLDIRTSAVPWATALGTLIQLEQGEASKKTQSFFF